MSSHTYLHAQQISLPVYAKLTSKETSFTPEVVAGISIDRSRTLCIHSFGINTEMSWGAYPLQSQSPVVCSESSFQDVDESL
jgi:hypothetical protein